MTALSTCLNSLYFAKQLPEVNLLLDQAHTKILEDGRLVMAVSGLTGFELFDDVVRRIDEAFFEKFTFGPLMIQDRRAGIGIIRRMNVLYQKMIKEELPSLWRELGEAALIRLRMMSEREFFQLFGDKCIDRDIYEHSDGHQYIYTPYGLERVVFALEGSILSTAILRSTRNCNAGLENTYIITP